MKTLADLQKGESAVIESIDGSTAVVQRILEMGVTEGEPVEVVGIAPLGDPIEIQIRNYNLSLRRAEAGYINVKPTA